jgi:hypothetical protein
MPARSSQPRLKHADRLPIHRDERGAWDLVFGASACFVEFISPSGIRRFTLEQFETSPDGQRIANSLTVAIARAPLG